MEATFTANDETPTFQFTKVTQTMLINNQKVVYTCFKENDYSCQEGLAPNTVCQYQKQ
jgi:hypothetical protein